MTVTVQHDCQLVQDFVPVQPLSAKNDVRSIHVADRTLLFTVGTDDALYLITQDNDAPTLARTAVPLLATQDSRVVTSFAVNVDPLSERFRLAACVTIKGKSSYFYTELIEYDDVDWTDEDDVHALWKNAVHLPRRSAVGNETRLHRDGTALVATTEPKHDARYYVFDPSDRTLTRFELPEAGAIIEQLAAGTVFGQRGVFLLYRVGTSRTMLFQTFPHPVFKTAVRYRYAVSGSVADFCIVQNDDGNDTLYTVGTHVVAFHDPYRKTTVARRNEVAGVSFSEIRAERRGNLMSLWLRGATKSGPSTIFYCSNDFKLSKTSATRRWTTPVPMLRDVNSFACTRGDDVTNDVFAITTVGNLIHLFQDEATTTWTRQRVEIGDLETAEEATSYLLTVKFNGLYAKDGTLAVGGDNGAKVRVSATQAVFCTVNESSALLSPKRAVEVNLQDEPELSVAITVEDLNVPQIFIEADFLPGGKLTLTCDKDVLQELGKLKTGDDLRDAKKSDGTKVFADDADAPDSDTCETFVQTTQALLEHFSDEDSDVETTDRSLSLGPKKKKKISLTFENGRSSLSTEDIDDHALEVADRGLFGISGGNGLGEVMYGIANGLIQEFSGGKVTLEMVVEAGKKAIEVIVRFGRKVAKWAVDTIHELGDKLSKFWNSLKMKWDALKDMLRFLFNFKDFTRTKDLFVHVINGSIDLLQDSLKYGQRKMNKFFDGLKSDLGADEFNDATYDDADPEESDDSGKPSSKENWFQRKIKMILEKAGLSLDIDAELPSVLFDMHGLGKETVKNFGLIGEYLKESVTDLVKGKVKIQDFLFDLLKKFGAFVIDGVQGVLNVVINLVDHLIEFMQDVINAQIGVPFISALLEKATGKKFTFRLIDIFGWVCAVPGTLMYKLATGSAIPYEEIESLDLTTLVEKEDATETNEVTVRSREIDFSTVRSRGMSPNQEDTNDINKRNRVVLGIMAIILNSLRIIILPKAVKASLDKSKAVTAYILGWIDIILAFFSSLIGLTRTYLASRKHPMITYAKIYRPGISAILLIGMVGRKTDVNIVPTNVAAVFKMIFPYILSIYGLLGTAGYILTAVASENFERKALTVSSFVSSATNTWLAAVIAEFVSLYKATPDSAVHAKLALKGSATISAYSRAALIFVSVIFATVNVATSTDVELL